MKKTISVLATIGMMSISTLSFAQTGNTGNRNITQLGCTTAGLCTIVIDGAQVGGQACRSLGLSLDQNGDGGRNAYAAILSAFISDTPVSFFVSGECSAETNPRPVFSTYRLEQNPA